MSTEEQKFVIQKFYTKDVSFESPGVPAIFNKEWKPEMSLDVHTSSESLDNDDHEVTVHLTVTVKSLEQVAFLVEVKQAGIFTISGFNKHDLERALACFCASNLYPYARVVISDLVMRAGFPQILLPPINFEAIFEARKQEQDKLSKKTAH